MTNGTVLMKPAPTTSPLKRSLRSASSHQKTSAEEDVALIREEERLIAEDEEITSEEDEADSEHAVERTMLTVALVNSVVESRDTSSQVPVKDEGSAKNVLHQKRKHPSHRGDEDSPGGIVKDGITPAEAKDEAREAVVSSSFLPQVGSSREAQPLPPTTGSVPNPLSKPLPPFPAPSSGSLKVDHSDAVPCPLPAISSEAKPENEPDKRKVIFDDTVATRPRQFSIDMDSVGLDFPDDGSESGAADIPSNRRDRAFSFECFAFGISADEPLPPLETTPPSFTPGVSRPRGDSIIFDPASFQEGGIHEQTALKGHNDPEPSTAPSSLNNFAHEHSHPGRAQSSTPEVGSSETSAPTMISAQNGAATFSPEILNKGGRIGIYLPEARRARIARFHAKRAKRIWRKRIKYDCRKKLADSRPRIKGRFVKRSDMDED